MKKHLNSVIGLIIGIINSTIGACGGIVAVEALKFNKLEQAKAHATAISVILPLTIVSAILYLCKGFVKISDAFIFIIPGTIGALSGAALLPKIPQTVLKRLFSFLMIYAGVRMMLK